MKLYYSISEVATLLGINASALRHWEKEFSQLRPNKISRGERRYVAADIAILTEIKRLLKEEGFTIEGARKHLENKKASLEVKQKLVALEKRLENVKVQLLELVNPH